MTRVVGELEGWKLGSKWLSVGVGLWGEVGPLTIGLGWEWDFYVLSLR